MATETANPTDQETTTEADLRKPNEEVDSNISDMMDSISGEAKEVDQTAAPISDAAAEATAPEALEEAETDQSEKSEPAVAEDDTDDATTAEDIESELSGGTAEEEGENAPEASDEANDSTEQDSEESEAPDSEADTSAESAKPGMVAKIMSGFKSNRKTIAACGCSLLLGAGGMFLVGGKPEPVVEEEETTQPPSYVAALNRRSEPIAPIVPFENLDPSIILLGERLFHDPGLSRNGKISCASCHDVERGGDDGRATPLGFDDTPGKMNAPTVLNAALNHAQFWDGRADTLEEQVGSPINNPDEMNSDWPRVVKFLTNNRRYNDEFVANFGEEPSEALVRTALATYQRALLTVGSPFDKWLQGDETALSADVYSGYHLFKKLNCVACHNGENVGGHIFQPLGKVQEYFTAQRPAREEDLGRFNVTGRDEDKHVFRVPSLRNVELTAPYLHDGSVESLEDAVKVMIEHQVGAQSNPEDIRRLVLFLESLTAPTPEMPKLPKPALDKPVVD